MTRSALRWLPAALISFLLFQGFQCGSPEFTGAKVQMQQKNYKEAIRLLELEVKKNPQNEEAWYFLGGLKADEGEYEGMNEAFDEALKISNLHARDIHTLRFSKWGLHLNAGVNYLERASSDSAEFFEKSIKEFNDAIRAWPDTGLTYRYLGYAYNNKGDLDGAAKAFQKAWELGKDVESVKRLGRIYLMKGNELKTKFESSNGENLRLVKTMDEIKKTTRKNDVMRVLGAPDKVRKGPRGTKKEDWDYNSYNMTISIDGEKVVNRTFTKSFSVKVDSTSYLAAMKEYDRAIEALEKAKNTDPAMRAATIAQGMTEAEIKTILAEPASRTQGVFEKLSVTVWSYPSFETSVYFDQGIVKGVVRPAPDNEVLNMMLSAYVESNRVPEATREFKQAVANDPTNATNHYIMGVLHRTMGDFDDAVASFKRAAELDTSNVDALFDLGATYYNWGVDLIRAAEDKEERSEEYRSKFEAALPYMEKVANKKVTDAQVWETLGTIYARLGQQDKAVKAFDKADKIRQGK